MIHYHGTPVGCKAAHVHEFLSGRHALVPFARPDDLAAVADYSQSFVLDNSAFSLWKQGGDVDVAGYAAWVDSIAGHPGLDWVLIPDKIDGDESANVELVTTWLRMGCRAASVPVWHLHESLEWLDYLCSNFQRVALGSSGQWSHPGTAPWWDRMNDAMGVACDETGRPRVRLHGLRMLDPAVFQHLPLASADSTNAVANSGATGRFGQYLGKNAAARAAFIADGIEAFNSAGRWVGRPTQLQFDLAGGVA